MNLQQANKTLYPKANISRVFGNSNGLAIFSKNVTFKIKLSILGDLKREQLALIHLLATGISQTVSERRHAGQATRRAYNLQERPQADAFQFALWYHPLSRLPFRSGGHRKTPPFQRRLVVDQLLSFGAHSDNPLTCWPTLQLMFYDRSGQLAHIWTELGMKLALKAQAHLQQHDKDKN